MTIFGIPGRMLMSALLLGLATPALGQAYKPGLGTTDQNPPPVKLMCWNGTTYAACTLGGGGGGGSSDATAANQTTQIAAEQGIRDRIGAITSPAAGTTNFILADIRTLLGGTLVVATHAVTQSGAWSTSITGALPAGTNAIGTATTQPLRTASTPGSGTIATANTFQSALAANATRIGCYVANTSTSVILFFVGAPGSATAATSVPINPGGSFGCATGTGAVLTDQISVTSATAGASFVTVVQ